MKICRVCKIERFEYEFYNDKKRLVCMKCKNKMTVKTSRDYTARNKELVLRHYSPELKCACAKCPFPYPGIEFLSLDHIKGKGDHDREIRRRLYQWVKSKGFPEGFQVLCFNCNLAKGVKSDCPHMSQKKSLKL